MHPIPDDDCSTCGIVLKNYPLDLQTFVDYGHREQAHYAICSKEVENISAFSVTRIAKNLQDFRSI
jgi:hypothetical protein